MKNFGLLAVMGVAVLALTGCNCNINVTNTSTDEDFNEYLQFCLENGGEYSRVYNQDETYGECFFPSGIGCRDIIMMTDECQFHPDLSNIDTEEKRLAGCEESVKGWISDFEEGEVNNIDWGEEDEGGASLVRSGTAYYTKDGTNWKLNVECIADFADGSIGTSYGEPEEIE